MAELGEEEVQVLGKTLKALTDFFRSYKNRNKKAFAAGTESEKSVRYAKAFFV